MKLKLFIITIIVASFAMIGLLGGCGGNSNRNTEESRDETIILWEEVNLTWKLTSYDSHFVTVDLPNDATVYKDGSTVVSLTISDVSTYHVDKIYSLHVDKIYLLPSTQNIAMSLRDMTNSVYSDFTATSSNDSIASIDYDDTSLGYTVILIKAHAVGTTRINITAEDGRKTWTDVIVVASASDMPTFVE